MLPTTQTAGPRCRGRGMGSAAEPGAWPRCRREALSGHRSRLSHRWVRVRIELPPCCVPAACFILLSRAPHLPPAALVTQVPGLWGAGAAWELAPLPCMLCVVGYPSPNRLGLALPPHQQMLQALVPLNFDLSPPTNLTVSLRLFHMPTMPLSCAPCQGTLGKSLMGSPERCYSHPFLC